MKNRALFPALIAAVLTLAALNLLMGRYSHRLPYFRLLEEIRTAQDPNLLFLGNSLLAGHVDEQAFEDSAAACHFKPLNAALGASLPPEHRLLFHYAVERNKDIHTLVVGMYDFQLTSHDKTKVADLVGNRMVGIDKRFPSGEVISAYGFGPFQSLQLHVLRNLPIAANRASVWKQVEILRRSLGTMGMPPEKTNSMGRVSDFAALESASVDLFDADAKVFVEKPDEFNASYEAIFRRARQLGIRVVIVVMPMTPRHRAIFYDRPLWHTYLGALNKLADQRAIRMIDASDWIPSQQEFADNLHMAPEGVHQFSVRLAKAMSTIGDDAR
jgi:hypothetical protein